MLDMEEVASIVLNTQDIVLWDYTLQYPFTVYENHIGRIERYWSMATFKSIDLRLVLGPLFYKYEKFKIQLVYYNTSWVHAYGGIQGNFGFGAGNNFINKLYGIWLSGLDFCNRSKKTQLGMISEQFQCSTGVIFVNPQTYQGGEIARFSNLDNDMGEVFRLDREHPIVDLKVWLAPAHNTISPDQIEAGDFVPIPSVVGEHEMWRPFCLKLVITPFVFVR